LEAPAFHTLRLIARQPWRHCVTSLRSAHWLASSLKLAARCPVSRCWPSCFTTSYVVITRDDSAKIAKDSLDVAWICATTSPNVWLIDGTVYFRVLLILALWILSRIA